MSLSEVCKQLDCTLWKESTIAKKSEKSYCDLIMLTVTWVEFSKHWTEEQCSKIASLPDKPLEDCKKECEERVDCSAINHSPTIQEGLCELQVWSLSRF